MNFKMFEDNKKRLFAPLAVFIIIMAVLVFLFYYNDRLKTGGETENQTGSTVETGGNTAVFSLLDEADKLVAEVQPKIDDETKTQYQTKINEINNNFPSLTNNEDKAAALSNMAVYKKYLGQYNDAYNLYLRALEIDSKYRPTWLALGDLLVEMKAYKSAEAAYRHSIELNVLAPEGYIRLAGLFKLTDSGQAEQDIRAIYEEALKQNRYDLQLLESFADWLAETGRKEEAIKYYEELKQESPANAAAIDRKIKSLND